MRVSEEAVEAAARAYWIAEGFDADQWERAIDLAIDLYSGELPAWIVKRKCFVRAALEAALPYLTPNPWVSPDTVPIADSRWWIGETKDGERAPCCRPTAAYGAIWQRAGSHDLFYPVRVMPLSALPEDTQASADHRASHTRDIRETER